MAELERQRPITQKAAARAATALQLAAEAEQQISTTGEDANTAMEVAKYGASAKRRTETTCDYLLQEWLAEVPDWQKKEQTMEQCMHAARQRATASQPVPRIHAFFVGEFCAGSGG